MLQCFEGCYPFESVYVVLSEVSKDVYLFHAPESFWNFSLCRHCVMIPSVFWLNVCSSGAMDYNHLPEVSVLFILNYSSLLRINQGKYGLASSVFGFLVVSVRCDVLHVTRNVTVACRIHVWRGNVT